MTASRHAHPMAEFLADLAPPLIASAPPVKKPAITIPQVSKYFPNPFQHKSLIQRISLGQQRTSIVRILLLPYPLDRAIERREHAPPDPEIAPEHRRPRFDGCESPDSSFAVGGVPEAFDAVPYCAPDAAHAESAAEVVEGDPGARIAGVIHYGRLYRSEGYGLRRDGCFTGEKMEEAAEVAERTVVFADGESNFN